MNNLISIIIPVYNAELSLKDCVGSILRQTYTNWELILVDDGSKDKSGEICDKYSNADSRIKVIHKANGGVSSARNAGLKAATGEWITFIDSDDTIGENYFNIDFSLNTDLYIPCIKPNIQPETYDGERLNRFVAENLCNVYFRVPWAKFLNKSTVANLMFDESIRLGEDTVFNLIFLSKCSRIGTVNNIKYNYVDRDFFKRYEMKVEEAVNIVNCIYKAYTSHNIRSTDFELFIPLLMSGICCRRLGDVFRYFTSFPVRKMYLNSLSWLNYMPLIRYMSNAVRIIRNIGL